uniref:Ig-like domain-containing protein n=1 Tax=Cyprinus carpio TaxID=7962 RepID=A0A8C1VQU2_CYPCA
VIAKDNEGWFMKASTEERAIEGYPVVLPLLFSCTSLNNNQLFQLKPNQDQRYCLEGNHPNHDVSLRINSVTLKDSDCYYCHVEILGHPHMSFESTLGTRLRVEAAPRILSLSAEGTEAYGFKAVCHVQGSPLPDVQWIEPDGVQEGDTSFPLSQDTTGLYHASCQLLDVKPRRQYLCAASNSLGKDQATLYLLPPSPERSTPKSSFLLWCWVASCFWLWVWEFG